MTTTTNRITAIARYQDGRLNDPDLTPLRAGVLNRKSTKQDDQKSIRQQNIENIEVCERNGWIVAEEYPLPATSASRFGGNNVIEKVLAGPLAGITAGRIDVLVAWRGDRTTRDMFASSVLLNTAETAGALLCARGRIYDPSDPGDRMAWGMDGLSAEREAGETRDRVMRDQRHAATLGRPHGRKLYGYRRVYDNSTPPKLIGQVPDENAKIVREIVDDFLATSRTFWIVRKLNDRGEPSPKGERWHTSQIKRILTMPSYAGLRQYRGEIIGQADWEPIITPAERERIFALLDDPMRHRAREKMGQKWLLSGIARCGVPGCGDFMYRSHDRNDRNIYWCRGDVNPQHKKGHLVRDMDKVDALVLGVFLNGLSQPGALDGLTIGDDSDTAAARAEIAELQARLDDATSEFMAGNITAAMLGKIETGLIEKIEGARKGLRTKTVPTSILDLIGANDVTEAWSKLDLEGRRGAIRHLLDIKIKPSSVPRGSKRFNPDDIEITWRY